MIFGLKQAKTSKEKIEEQLEKVSKFFKLIIIREKTFTISGVKDNVLQLVELLLGSQEYFYLMNLYLTWMQI
ncbi:MAG: hypothetical protein CM1200mP13_05090 [Candidatus Pelagibacterales bacterium]|nr:MAG: hypothetical protein CM1200mP13_05090 [Pelagibacterales bacterium]